MRRYNAVVVALEGFGPDRARGRERGIGVSRPRVLGQELAQRRLAEQAVKLSEAVVKSPVFDEEFIFEGTKNIIDIPELRQSGKLTDVLQAFEEKSHICSLLESCMKEDSVQIFIGSEIGLDNTDELGMVIKPYHRGGNIVGTMGVIGPKRMKYSQVVSIVDYSSKIISKMLNDYYEGDK